MEPQHEIPTDIQVYLDVKAKIDYRKVGELTKFKPHVGQREILDTYFKGDFSVMTLTCSRRFGKSFVVSEIATVELLIPNASILLFVPTFSNAKTIFENVERNIRLLGVKITSRDSKALTFTLENRATIFVVTNKSYENALGRRYSTVLFEEAQTTTDLINIWENFINPAQSDFGIDSKGFSNSKTLFIGTARDETNEMYQVVKRAKNKKYKGYINFTFTIYDNPFIPREFIEQKQKELDPITFNREYMGIWSKGIGELVYYVFDKEKHTITQEEREKYMPGMGGVFLVAIDVGWTDNSGYLLAYRQPGNGRIVIFREYKANELPMSHHVKEFKSIEQIVPVNTSINRVIDPSAVQTANDLAVDSHYYTFPAFNKIDEGVKIVNTEFYKGNLVISEECPDLIDEIEHLMWQNPATKTVKRTKEHKHFDLSLSTMRYLVATYKIQSDMNIVAV